MRIAIGGIMHESNTFASQEANRARFEEGSLTFGEAILPVWKDAHHEMGGFITGAKEYHFELVPTVMAWATPAGRVADAVLDEVTERIIQDCRSSPIDGLLLALHGAMVTPHHASGDREVLRRIREALGPDLPIIASLDFHGNLTEDMGSFAQALVAYQTYPHVDQKQRGLLAAEILTRTIRQEIHPGGVLVKRPMMMNLLGQHTQREPMASLLARAREAEKREKILSISILAGFPYADVPHVGPSVVVNHDNHPELALEVANDLADYMWQVRHELNVPCPSPQEAVLLALHSPRLPVLLIDLGDNIGGGSSGDGTVLLEELLKQRATGAIVVLYAPEAVRAAVQLGVGKCFTGHVGGMLDSLHGKPISVTGIIRSIHDGTWEETEARHGGRRFNDQGRTVMLSIEGGNTLVLNSLRTPPFSLGQLTSLGLDPRQARVIVVKSAVAYKAAYEPLHGRIIEVDTPGVTAINPGHLPYRNIPRPMYPLDAE